MGVILDKLEDLEAGLISLREDYSIDVTFELELVSEVLEYAEKRNL